MINKISIINRCFVTHLRKLKNSIIICLIFYSCIIENKRTYPPINNSKKLIKSVMAEIYNPRNSKIKNFFISSRTLALFLISACGSSSEGRKDAIIKPGFGSDYVPPPFGYDEPIGIDNHFKVLMPILASPYWVDSLAMENGEEKIAELLGENDSEFLYSFPTARPDYILVTITGWAPASDKMQEAAKEIFSLLSTTLNVDFNRSESSNGYNNIAISQSTQTLTAGFGFFPNSNFELGSDIFVSKTYNSPEVYPNSLTNYDYEILVHEIGHALGLKHPFEGDRSNVAILNSHEDKTEFTAMSYNESSSTFDKLVRSLSLLPERFTTIIFSEESKFESPSIE